MRVICHVMYKYETTSTPVASAHFRFRVHLFVIYTREITDNVHRNRLLKTAIFHVSRQVCRYSIYVILPTFIFLFLIKIEKHDFYTTYRVSCITNIHTCLCNL